MSPKATPPGTEAMDASDDFALHASVATHSFALSIPDSSGVSSPSRDARCP